MNLSKCLSITKCVKFTVFVYSKGHIRGRTESLVKTIDIERNEKGELPEYIEFGKCKVKEIIPHSGGASVVVEVGGEMKREKLEKHLGKIVEIVLFDGDVIQGELYKTREEQFKNDPNLYIPNNNNFLINPQSCLFKCSYVKKVNGDLVE